MTETVANLDSHLYVQTWNRIVEAMAEVRAQAALCSTLDAAGLPELRRRIGASLNSLQTRLVSSLGQIDADQVFCPLILYTDETILGRLPVGVRPAWPLLQQTQYGFSDGGERFFQLLEEKLHKPDAPELLLEVMLYCLGHGFQGRYRGYKDKAQHLERYRTRLEQRLGILSQKEGGLTKPRPSSSRRAAERTERARRPGVHLPLIAPIALYLATFLILCAIPLFTVFLSNLELRSRPPAPPRGSRPAAPEQEPSSRSRAAQPNSEVSSGLYDQEAN